MSVIQLAKFVAVPFFGLVVLVMAVFPGFYIRLMRSAFGVDEPVKDSEREGLRAGGILFAFVWVAIASLVFRQ